VLAAQCATVMSSAIEIEGLRTALASRDTIGQGTGILMERYGVNGAEAFDLLRTTSQERNTKLNLVTEQSIEQRRLP
jgi:AmiR/NasT family two-component response regulator